MAAVEDGRVDGGLGGCVDGGDGGHCGKVCGEGLKVGAVKFGACCPVELWVGMC